MRTIVAMTGVVALIGLLVVTVLDESAGNDDARQDRRPTAAAKTDSAEAARAAPSPSNLILKGGRENSTPPSLVPAPRGPGKVASTSTSRTAAEAPTSSERRASSSGSNGAHGSASSTKASATSASSAGSSAATKSKPTTHGGGGQGGGGASDSGKKDSATGPFAEPVRRSTARGPFNGSGGLERVAHFLASGGANLKGQVVDADTGRALSAATVEAHLDGKVMETSTDANGGFHMTGLIPNQRVTVWIVGKNEAFVAEYMEVRMPGEGETADVGVTRLLRGSELAERIAGWVGVFMGRGGRRNVVTAVNPWLPGDRAGIEPGDTVLSIDGRNVEQLGPRATTFLLRGPVGSKTTLSIQNHAGEVRKIELERVAR